MAKRRKAAKPRAKTKARPAKRAAKKLTHIDKRGQARMVDVSAKLATERTAIAEGRVMMRKETLELVLSGNAQQGRRAGRGAARRHHGGQAHARADPAVPSAGRSPRSRSTSTPTHELPGCWCSATVKVTGPTGVEMEALTAVSVACLTIYDMIKAVERGVRIEGIRLIDKTRRQVGRLSCATT